MKKGKSLFEGRKHSIKTRLKISKANQSIKLPKNGIIEISYWGNCGLAICSKCGKKRNLSYDTAFKIYSGKNKNVCNSCSKTGKKYSDEVNKRKGRKKEKNNKWKGGVSTENNIIRGSAKMKKWRKAVFDRDNYTCKKCGKDRTYLNSHHIKSFAHYPKLRFNLNNGITLCEQCHKNIHKKIESQSSV